MSWRGRKAGVTSGSHRCPEGDGWHPMGAEQPRARLPGPPTMAAMLPRLSPLRPVRPGASRRHPAVLALLSPFVLLAAACAPADDSGAGSDDASSAAASPTGDACAKDD